VLQNDKYIEYTGENSVEVIALGRLDEALAKGDARNADELRKTAEYDAKDEDGKPVKYMMEFPGLTKEQLLALNSSKASSYNDTGHIPFVCIVDPFTEKEMWRSPGGAAAKSLMEQIDAQKKVLNSAHGPSLSRAALTKVNTEGKRITEALAKAGVAKSMADYRKLEQSIAKQPDSLKKQLEPVLAAITDAATKTLDEAEGLIGSGDLAGAKKLLDKLGRSLDGTSLEARMKELTAKAKPQ